MPGVASLKEVAGLQGELRISDLVFYLGPRINAAGRLAHAKQAVELLIGEKEQELGAFAQKVNAINTERKSRDQETTAEALEMIQQEAEAKKTTVLYKEDWHKGIIGIVASRCIEHHYRPTIIFTKSGEKITGSARSVDSFDIHHALEQCSDLLLEFGGHFHAAGLSLSPEKLPDFKKRFEEVVADSIDSQQLAPRLDVDLEVRFDFFRHKTFNILKQMGPFGPCNMQPVFYSEEVYLHESPRVLKEEHLKLKLRQGTSSPFDAIGFGMGYWAEQLQLGQPLRLTYQLEENNYRGNKSLQLLLKDIKIDS